MKISFHVLRLYVTFKGGFENYAFIEITQNKVLGHVAGWK